MNSDGRLTEIDLLGPVRVSKAFLEAIIARGALAKIVNIASDAGRAGSSGETVYAGTKGGVIAFTNSLAREMARHPINSTSCVPARRTRRCCAPPPTRCARASPTRSRSAASLHPRRSPTLWSSSHPTAPATSPARCSVSVSGGLTMAG